MIKWRKSNGGAKYKNRKHLQILNTVTGKKRGEFLETMEEIIPWEEWVTLPAFSFAPISTAAVSVAVWAWV